MDAGDWNIQHCSRRHHWGIPAAYVANVDYLEDKTDKDKLSLPPVIGSWLQMMMKLSWSDRSSAVMSRWWLYPSLPRQLGVSSLIISIGFAWPSRRWSAAPYHIIYEDISTDITVKNLCDRPRSIIVRTHSSLFSSHPAPSSTYTVMCIMKPVVNVARSVYVKNMSFCFGLVNWEGENVKNLPPTVVHVAALLNPLYPHRFMVHSSLLTVDQMNNGIESLVSVIEKRYELDAPVNDDSSNNDIEEDTYTYLTTTTTTSSNHQRHHSSPLPVRVVAHFHSHFSLCRKAT